MAAFVACLSKLIIRFTKLGHCDKIVFDLIQTGAFMDVTLSRLAAIENKYSVNEARLSSSEIYQDPALWAQIAKEQKDLEPAALAYRRYKAAEQSATEAEELLADPEMAEIAEEELRAAKETMETLREQFILLLPGDPDDEKNAIVEIRGGAGGEEAALFAHSLFRMYCMYAQAHGFGVEVANMNETELGGIKEVSFVVSGRGAYARYKYESGVHRVQRVPETETSGRIHTSTCTVAVLLEADEVDFELDLSQVQIDTFRSSGAGGQKVNKTESAIRVTHLPTGIVVECQDERSQYKNKDRALKILASRLYELERRKQTDSIAAERKSQVGTGDRSERIRTYNFPQGRVTDHRIGLTLYKIDSIMDGDLDAIIDALTSADRAEKLANSSEEGIV